MAKVRVQVSETRNLDLNLQFGWWQQMRRFDISPIFRILGWLFVSALVIMPFVMYAEWGAVRPESEQLFNLTLLGGSGLLLLVAWISLGKFQHFADAPMFLGVLIFAMTQIALLLLNATTGAANQLNTFGGPGSKVFAGVAVMAFVAIFYTAVVTLNTRRKRRLLGLAILGALLAAVIHITIARNQIPAGQLSPNGFIMMAAWLVSLTVILGGYRRLLLVGSVFAFVLSTYLLVSSSAPVLAWPMIAVISVVVAIVQYRKRAQYLKDGWKDLYRAFKMFVRGEMTWADFAFTYRPQLWLLTAVALTLVSIIVMLSSVQYFSTVIPADAAKPPTVSEPAWQLARAEIESVGTEFSRIWTNLSALGKLFTGNGFSANLAEGNISTIFAATGLLGLASYLILAFSALLLAVNQWRRKPYASWAGIWWPVFLLLPIYLVFYRVDVTVFFVWWAMFAHLSAIENWEKQNKIYQLWNLLNFRGREYTRSFVVGQIIVLVLLGALFVLFTNSLLDLFVRQVL